MANNTYIANATKYYGTETLLTKNHMVDDIIKAISKYQILEASKYDKFSHQFWKGNTEHTAKEIYKYLDNSIQYIIEHPDLQTIKSPGAIVHEGFGDCKHYASFANGVLASLKRKGYPITGEILYRYAGYNPVAPEVHHVFSVIRQNNGKEIWIDPVVRGFNYKKPYYFYKDEKVTNDMPELKYIAGTEIGNIFDDIKKGAKNTFTAITKGAQNTAQKLKDNPGQTVQRGLLKVGGVTARNSFLLLLKINGFNISHRLYDFIHKSPENRAELEKKWLDLGGDFSSLERNINEGMSAYWSRNKTTREKYNAEKGFVSGIIDNPVIQNYFDLYGHVYPNYIMGISDNSYWHHNYAVGAEPVSAAAILTAAASVIAALAPILAKAGWSKTDEKNLSNVATAGAAALNYAENGAAAPNSSVILPNGTQKKLLETKVSTTADGTKVVTIEDTGDIEKATGGQSTFTESIKQGFDSFKSFVLDNKTPIMIFGGVALAYKFGLFDALSKSIKTKKRK